MPTQEGLPLLDIEPKEVPDQTHEEKYRILEHQLRDLPWADVFSAVMAKGYKWREAAFVAWQSIPKNERIPTTKGELANMLGCDASKITKMGRDPRLQGEQLLLARGMYIDAMPDIIAASIQVAIEPTYKATAERNNIINNVTGIGTNRVQVSMGADAANQDLSQLSDEELLALEDGEDA